MAEYLLRVYGINPPKTKKETSPKIVNNKEKEDTMKYFPNTDLSQILW